MLLERNENLKDKNSFRHKIKPREGKDQYKMKENNNEQHKQKTHLLKKHPKPQSSASFVITETDKIRFGNLKKILSHELSKQPAHFKQDFLERHRITPEIRARMVDWMIEVLSSFTCTQNTFFVSVDIMDSFLTKTNRCFETKDIHIIGVTCMLLASKMEEIIPFKVSTVVDKMTHGKMTKKSIVDMENEILQTLGF